MSIVEDDDNLSRGIAFSFEKEGFDVACAGTLESASALLQNSQFLLSSIHSLFYLF